ncbi:unnamed protein product [Larinioides sclopetarius]|uniref:Uncharacterized protein n=1 Tax=Larinioides sclopetarius TaxID=280406 RepID=A0AAV1Z3Y5_9ARAC
MSILQIILNVAHFMVNSNEILHVYTSAHLDSEIEVQVALIVPACYCTFSRNLRCQPIVIPEEIHGFIDVCVAPAHIFISQNIASICICTYENIQ